MTAELARHVGHRAHLLDPRRLRCDDCTQTVWLPDTAGSTSTSSSSPIPGKDDPRCAQHEFEHADTCRVCAADAKADPTADGDHGHRTVVHRATADVATRAAEARAALVDTIGPRSPGAIAARIARPDPERMAAARAELDTLRQPAEHLEAAEPIGGPT